MSNYTKPSLRERLKKKIISGTRGGKAGQWSARKAQLLAKEYKDAGGGYTSGKRSSQKSLDKWTKEKWGTKSGKPSSKTGERYLPKKAREALSNKEYKKTSDKKRRDTSKGKQHSPQPKTIAKKTAKYRK